MEQNQIINFLFFKKKDTNYNFEDFKIPIFFHVFVVLNSLVFLSIFLYIIIKFTLKGKNHFNKFEILNSLKKVIPTIIMIFGFPFILFVFFAFISQMLNIFSISYQNDPNVAKNIFNNLRNENIDVNIWTNISKFNDFSPLDFNSYKNLKISTFELMFFPSITGISLISIFSKAFIKILNKIFQIFILFLISPFVFSTLLINQNKKFLRWKEMFISKSLSIFIFVLLFKIFDFYLKITNEWILNINELSSFQKNFFSFFISIGGAIGIIKTNKIISELLGEENKLKNIFLETSNLLKNINYFSSNKNNFYKNLKNNIQNFNKNNEKLSIETLKNKLKNKKTFSFETYKNSFYSKVNNSTYSKNDQFRNDKFINLYKRINNVTT
ncbi:Mbov_0396 family ICE element transmembrane protein [[Mycoplasma] collis]|uniref:Mbov_0396 family ICE element transmembrane protein n=1 Tax=[Mycoplasma] collis TaxID=2127 RepID=UPI0038CC140B